MRVKKVKRKKYKEKENAFLRFNHEIYGILLMSLAVLTGLSCYTDMAGVFGQNLRGFLLGILSYPAFIVPLLIAAYGYMTLMRKNSPGLNLKITFTAVLSLIVSAIIHVFHYSNGTEEYFSTDSIARLYASGTGLQGGGVLGGLISIPVVRVFGTAGAFVIFTTILIVFIMLATNISMVTVFNFIKKSAVFIQKIVYKLVIGENEKPAGKKIKPKMPEAEEKTFPSYEEEQGKIEDVPWNDNDIKEAAASKDGEPKIRKQKSQKPADVEPVLQQGTVKGYVFPDINLLKKHNDDRKSVHNSKSDTIAENSRKLEEILKSFGVEAKVINVSRGPTITRYELHPSTGVKVSKIVNLADDISLNLAASGVRIEAPIPGKAAVGIEVPNKENITVGLRDVLETPEFQNHPSKLAFALGRNISGECVIADIAKMPHLLIAGATGAGKSVCINTIITSLLYKASPEEVRLLMIDPKVVELGIYNGIPHLLIPVVTDPRKAAGALNWAVQEMMNRYKLFAEKGVRDIRGYNMILEESGEPNVLPHIVVIIDELADLMMVAPGEVEDAICRLAQMARAAGMHLVIATQRPSVDVITGVIKANIPSRISFAVSSQVDSRTILDMAGAEKLLGKGDMLFYPVGEPKPIRIQGAFITDKEVEAVAGFIKKQAAVEYNEDIIEEINNLKGSGDGDPGDNDELLPQAIETVVDAGMASVSLIQRKFKVGYARAARIIDQMEARGIVGGFEGSKPRQVLMNRQQFYEMMMNSNDKIEGGVS